MAALMLLTFTGAAEAQNIGSILGKVASAVTSGSSSDDTSTTGSGLLGNLVGNLLGTSKVSKSKLIGTWSYTEPAVVFESSNIAGKIAGTAIETKVEKQISSVFKKAGFTKGKVKMTFDNSGNYTAQVSGKSITGTYELSGSTLTLYKGGVKTLKANVSLSGGKLQIAFEADQLSGVLNGVVKVASSLSTTVKTLSGLMGSVDGMHIGMKFEKE